MEHKKKYYLDFVGLALLGSLSWGYMLWGNYLAEFNLSFSFLDFPLFISEIFLFICGVIFIWRSRDQKFFENKFNIAVVLYFIFVLSKAFYGYIKWGPLAFRNAALVYYPLTAVLTYSFYKKEFFNRAASFFLLMLFCVLFWNMGSIDNWIFTCAILSFVLLFKGRTFLFNKICLLLLVFLIPYQYFFHTSRMMIVSNFLSLIYVAWVVLVIVKARSVLKWSLVGIITVSMLFLMNHFSNKAGILSMLKFDLIKSEYAKAEKFYQERKDFYAPLPLKVKVYNPRAHSSQTDIPAEISGDVSYDKKRMEEAQQAARQKKPLVSYKYSKVALDLDGGEQDQNVQLKIGNILFRIFIWQDVLEDIVAYKKFLGVDFGKPVRSKRLEILNWGSTEWKRDGWIAVHNSYLHMMYRMGVVGIALIVFLVGNLFRMIHGFKKKRDLIGLLLCSVLINWFIAANFLLIFELPYTAIPIWSLYGVVMAYYKKLP